MIPAAEGYWDICKGEILAAFGFLTPYGE